MPHIKKLQNIEFLRVVFCFVILYFHLFIFLPNSNGVYDRFSNFKGYLAVDFFFIIAGYFLFFSTQKPDATVEMFIKRKILRLWPLMFFSILIAWVVAKLGMTHFAKYDNLSFLLFLQSTGIGYPGSNNSAGWFVCCLVWPMLFYYCLSKITRIKTMQLIVGCIVFLSYALLCSFSNGVFASDKLRPEILMLPMLTGGIMRAFAGIGGGGSLAAFYQTKEQIFS